MASKEPTAVQGQRAMAHPMRARILSALDGQELSLGEVGFALRLRRESRTRDAVEAWFEAEAERPEHVPADDWLHWEQEKHSRLLTTAA